MEQLSPPGGKVSLWSKLTTRMTDGKIVAQGSLKSNGKKTLTSPPFDLDRMITNSLGKSMKRGGRETKACCVPCKQCVALLALGTLAGIVVVVFVYRRCGGGGGGKRIRLV